MSNTIFIGSDHAGYELKKFIIDNLQDDYEVIDCGPTSLDPQDDYPDYAKIVCEKILDHQGRGILICDTGIGMSIAANRFEGIRAALVTSPFMAERSRLHNDANVICLGQENTGHDESLSFVHIWLATDFTAVDRHIRRIEAIDRLG